MAGQHDRPVAVAAAEVDHGVERLAVEPTHHPLLVQRDLARHRRRAGPVEGHHPRIVGIHAAGAARPELRVDLVIDGAHVRRRRLRCKDALSPEALLVIGRYNNDSLFFMGLPFFQNRTEEITQIGVKSQFLAEYDIFLHMIETKHISKNLVTWRFRFREGQVAIYR